MALNPLAKSIQSAVRMNDSIGDLFARIGTTQNNPGGEVTTLYTNAQLAMESALRRDDPLPPARHILSRLRADLIAFLLFLFRDAVALGAEEGTRQMDWYGDNKRRSVFLTEQLNASVNVVMSRFDAQEAAIIALLLAGMNIGQILGDEVRAGIMSATEVTNAASYWSTNLVWGAFDEVVNSDQRGGRTLQKVAVAVIDGRTTDCCLRVHGQIQPFRDPFHLTGTPRFADYMDWPGFHWYCRTSVAVYDATFDTGLTEKMRNEASAILLARKSK